MIYYDVTTMRAARQKSGLTRVSFRLREELAGDIREVVWSTPKQTFCLVEGGEPAPLRATDWLLTVELFNETERPGLRGFLAEHRCRLAAFFHDAIPVRFPAITWPASVERHPEYLKMLAGFDRILAVSRGSREDLENFWRWQGVPVRAKTVEVNLGADLDGSTRMQGARVVPVGRPRLLCVGILEPRKNQAFLLEVCDQLWREGVDFELHVVGRVNPHFGGPIEKGLRQMAKRESRLHYHAAAGDGVLSRLYRDARAVVFPTIAEGCGLPVLEALWHGVPCVCSDLPVLRENANGGGCLTARLNDAEDWRAKLRAVVTDEGLNAKLSWEAAMRPLPRWADTAAAVLQGME